MGNRTSAILDPTGSAGRIPASRGFLLLLAIAFLAMIVCASIVVSVVMGHIEDRRSLAAQQDGDAIRHLHIAIAEANAAVLAYVLTSEPAYLDGYYRTDKRIMQQDRAILARVRQPDPPIGGTTPAEVLSALRQAWQTAVEQVRDKRSGDAVAALRTVHAQELFETLSGTLETAVGQQIETSAARAAAAALWQNLLRAVMIAAVLIGAAMMLAAIRRIGRAIRSGDAASHQIEQLFTMGDMLQSASDLDDTNAVLRATALRLLPGLSGAMYIFNNSRDRLDLATQWGTLPADHCDHMAPSTCWALKRGKPHLNEVGPAALRCAHGDDGLMTLDIPMTARGQLHGLMEIAAVGAHPARQLEAARPIAMAIGDAMSLALSNAALRDQLRNQALRDGLTSLYNRRFLEEVRERLCLDSERRASSIAMIMLDLDHFKKLNDTHGHGAGDAVLREIAATILASIRATDIACRYGGEELLVLLPDCGLDMAAGKAEQIRNRIASLTFSGGINVTASFGVAAMPETSLTAQALLADADTALYQAKTGGRDRVAMAPRRPGRALLKTVEDLASPALAEVA